MVTIMMTKRPYAWAILSPHVITQEVKQSPVGLAVVIVVIASCCHLPQRIWQSLSLLVVAKEGP